MATEEVGSRPLLGTSPRFFPSLAPALLVSTGFIDLGKWVVAVEGGSQFGFNPVLLVLLFSCSAIFCQYLATCIAAVTGKNLAQICCEEYYMPAYLLLLIQAEVSRIVSDISMVLGVAYGFNLLFGVDLLICTVFASVVAIAFPACIKIFGKHINEVQYASISGFVLLFYVMGILIAQPEVPVSITGAFPRLTLENSYLVMALLGSNVVVHNFYSQSAMVQKQRRYFNSTVDQLLYDHFFAIFFIFSGIFLANCVLMNSATSLFDNVGLTVQDLLLLVDQMFSVQIVPIALSLSLLLSSLISALIWVFGGQVVMDNLFGIHASFWVRLSCLKVVVVVPAIYYAGTAGSEGLYQLLIFSQVILAVLLPSSVIPLFRVASSKLLMGTFTMSWYLEILALFTFIWMFSSNLVFISEALFGSGSWIVNLRSSMMLPFYSLIIIACISSGLTLYLMVTPLKSTSNEVKFEFHKNEQMLVHEHKNDSKALDYCEVYETAQEPNEASLQRSLPILDFNLDSTGMISDSCNEYQNSAALNLESSYQTSTDLNFETASMSSASDIVMKESHFLTDLHSEDPVDKFLDNNKVDLPISEDTESSQQNAEIKMAAELIVDPHKGDEVVWEQVDFSEENLVSVVTEGSEESKSSKCKNSDAGGNTRSLSKMSGLGRAARRQFAATLDEFWGHLFDFHGLLTQEARSNKVGILLGMDTKSISPAKTNAGTNEASRKHIVETERGLSMLPTSRDCSFPTKPNISNEGSFYGLQMGAPSWFSSSQTDLYGQRSSTEPIDLGERRYSSLHLLQNADNRDYQPATIHGYQISSYFRSIAGRPDSSGFSVDQPLPSKSSESFIPNYNDQVQYVGEHGGFGPLGNSGLESWRVTGITGQAELSGYDSSFSGVYEDLATAEKKYHSLPDISGLSVLGRNSSLNNRNILQSDRFGPYTSMVRTPIGHPQFINPSYRAEGTPLTFDELSPSTHYKDILSSQSSSGVDTKSLWSRQPYEQLFGMSDNSQSHGDAATDILNTRPETFSYAELEVKLLRSFKECIMKVLKLEGSDWLVRHNAGADEELIDQLVMKENFLSEIDMNESNVTCFSVPQHISSDQGLSSIQGIDLDLYSNEKFDKCGESCIWRAGLIVSFGVWCIRRILELSLVESRPELWGKYTYVLNRLQGILEPAFSKPRLPVLSCPCLEIPLAYIKDYGHQPPNSLHERASMSRGTSCTTSGMILDLIKDVEAAISSRKGRSGTAAGDVAFPKGKENLASVLKRYKRRLSNKSSGTNHGGGSSSRKFPLPSGLVL